MNWLTFTRAAVAAALLAMGGAHAAPALAQTSGADAPTIRDLPDDEALQKLGDELGKSVRSTQSDPSIPDILAELERNIEATRKVRELLESGNAVTDEHVAQIAAEIGEIAGSFRKIADLAPGVFQRRIDEISNLDALGSQVDFRIADARSRMKELTTNNKALSEMLRNETLPQSEIEKMRLTRQANEAELHSLEAAIAAWSFFAERHDEIMTRIDDQTDDLDVFFHALRENARVYEAASRTLNLANSVKQALADLDTLQNLDALRSQLVQSWDDLMKIVDEVNDGLLLNPGM